MRIALSVKNKLGFIDGSISKPLDSEVNLLIAWVRNNNIVISWLLNSVSKDISASILFANSAEDIWNDLRDRFQQSNGPRIFQLRRDLITLRQDQDPVSVYFTKIKAIWEELNHFRPMCSCGKCSCDGVKNLETYVQTDYTMIFLMGLNDSFAHIRSQVLLLDPIPPISRVFALVVQEERQISVGNQASNIFQNVDRNQMEQFMDMMIQQLSTSVKKDDQHEGEKPQTLSVDSGASRHICSSANAFISLKAVENSRVTLPNSAHVDVKFYGDIKLGDSLVVLDVLYIPEFKFNLLSVSSLIATTQNVISFYCDSFIIQDMAIEKMIGKGRRIDGLYVLDASSIHPGSSINQVGSHVPLGLWGKCIMTATYLVNRVPSPSTQNKSSYELLHQKPVDYAHLRVFGCLAFASTLAAHRDKFMPRARIIDPFPSTVLPTPAPVDTQDPLNNHIPPPIHLNPRSHDLINEQNEPLTQHSENNVLPNMQRDTMDRDAHDDSGITASDSLPLAITRNSSRTSKPPSYIRDYHCDMMMYNSPPSSASSYTLTQSISYDSHSNSYKNLVLNISSHGEPQFYHQAVKLQSWRAAMRDKLDAMHANNTCSVVALPPGKQPIGCRWVYKIKYKSDGSVDRHKARLVAKGYTQREGVEFFETFSPVAKLATVKVFLALAASQNWILAQLDVNNAFLNGDLYEEVYMDLPLGYHPRAQQNPETPRIVCHLHKSIYGLRQASRQWYTKFSQALMDSGFKQS
ncbi:uncharacterized protein LOC142529437 [Primulina tabacum]|uniref:uncharacterized protein LOC142529437 n=1 Tax=Primulina tabacum TaxID=48773 RepID=UPI003F59ADC5